MTLYESWYEEFFPKLGKTRRWEAFSFIAEDLLNRQGPPGIIETGCARQVGNWVGDGQSTLVWDWIVVKTGGILRSCDINRQTAVLAQAQCTKPNSYIHSGDSIEFLRREYFLDYLVSTASLLYLDSFDYSRGQEHLAELHHVGELACVYDKLPSGCLIAVDDCHNDTYGKHVLVKVFFDRINIQPEISSYVTVWRKP